MNSSEKEMKDPEKASTSDHNSIHLPAAERDPCGFFQPVEFFSENLLTNEKMPGIIYLNHMAHI